MTNANVRHLRVSNSILESVDYILNHVQRKLRISFSMRCLKLATMLNLLTYTLLLNLRKSPIVLGLG